MGFTIEDRHLMKR